jgi:hypothetical protein
MKDETFKPRTMSISELAQLYFPQITVRSAGRVLREWIFSDLQLLEQLHANGYINGKRVLTPKQVEIIVTRIGEP